MGYAIMVGFCACCKKTFTFNPNKVPSVRVNGTREPVCRGCLAIINTIREEKGMDLIEISPDAYEPIEESEL